MRGLVWASMTVIGAVAAGDKPTLFTPAELQECQKVQLHWQGGQPPYKISALPGGQPQAEPLAELGTFKTEAAAWNVSIPAGTSVSLKIEDGAKQINYAAQLKVQDGCSVANSKGGAGKKAASSNSKGSRRKGKEATAASSSSTPVADASAPVINRVLTVTASVTTVTPSATSLKNTMSSGVTLVRPDYMSMFFTSMLVTASVMMGVFI